MLESDKTGTRNSSLENRGGISHAVFCLYNQKVTITGWFLSEETIDKILVYYGDNIILGKATFNQPRSDVYNKYPQFNNPNSGFILEARVPVHLSNTSPIYINVFSGNKLIHRLRSKLTLDDKIKSSFEMLLKNNTVYLNDTPTIGFDPVKLKEINAAVKRIDVNFRDYKKWMNKIKYKKNYPKYVREFPQGLLLNKKSLQHYLSIKLLGIDKAKNKRQTCLDVASSQSVFPDILTAKYAVKKAYRQDWLYKQGVHGDRIGGNATAIPLPPHSIDKISLHCSWEHFEDNSDVEFIKEAHRLLKEKGTVCIIPLYMAEEYFAVTSPGIWLEKYSPVTRVPPKFEKGMIVCVNDRKKQRQEKFYDPQTLNERVLHPYQYSFNFEIIHFANHKEFPGCPVYALKAVRKS
ncbi:MAG: methyltransferase domain-containing protein [Candidatus Aminicenantes bacterium]|jgi:hypothetical protein